MKPPICEFCDERFDPSEGALIRCVARESDVAWRERAEREHLVGHPPDTGWFCGQHAPAAQALAATHTLPEVMAALKASDAPAPTSPVQGDDASPSIVPGQSHILDLYRDLRAALPDLAREAGLDPATLTTRSHRDWTPMDRTTPPNCPFSDTTTDEATVGGVTLTLTLEVAYWSEDDAARSYLTCDLRGAGERDFRVGAWSPAAGDPYRVEAARVRGAVPAVVEAALRGGARA